MWSHQEGNVQGLVAVIMQWNADSMGVCTVILTCNYIYTINQLLAKDRYQVALHNKNN